jgi:2-keto-4-pentenoate hydratase
MPKITGGRVAYKRTIQPEPFESKSAEVEFMFTVDDDESPPDAAAAALHAAKLEVHEALGLVKSKQK